MKILLVCMKYDYGMRERGHSYEWNHFYLGLKQKFKEIRFFDFMSVYQELGREGMQTKLLREITEYRPNICVFSLFTNQFECAFVKSLRSITKTLCFFHDDGWRKNFVLKWAENFDAFTTSNPNGIALYRELGFSNVIYLPFGVNHNIFRPDFSIDKDIDVSFVGSWHPYRRWVVDGLAKKGINVTVYGYNWPNGMLTTNRMVDIFQRSKISLNISNCSSWHLPYLLSSPRALINSIRSPKINEQLKGRLFEIPACGSIQMSYYVEGLERLFVIGDEILIYDSIDSLFDKIEYLLNHHEIRNNIANAGYQRTIQEHTYADKFTNAFLSLGWLE